MWFKSMCASVLLLGGCASFDLQPADVGVAYKIEHFPALTQTIVYVDEVRLSKECDPHVKRVGAKALGCARVNFDKKTCTIFLKEDSTQSTLLHEQWHCEGWDHREGDALHQGFLRWQEKIKKQSP